MPKIGMEPLRRKALVDAALRTIGHHGSLNVTMSDIAREAGVSAALAHHYFGSKQQLLLETIRSLLRDLRRDAVAALTRASGPRERLSAIVHVSFQSDQFTPETVAAWLAFYVEAQRSEETRRLLVLYSRRLRSNLMASLNQGETPSYGFGQTTQLASVEPADIRPMAAPRARIGSLAAPQ